MPYKLRRDTPREKAIYRLTLAWILIVLGIVVYACSSVPPIPR